MKILLYINSLIILQVVALKKPVVYTSLGSIQGNEEKTVLGKKIYSFLGVPYAKPPIGEYRFEAPRPVEKWRGRWSATENAPECLQHMLNYDIPDLITGEEDCLYLNIYTPSLSNASLLPVLVYFHGGAFMYGSGNKLTPHFILDRADFIYITVNYRLGPLGFLSTGDDVVPGNNGLKDQSMSLKWVQEHVAAFGGNKDDVTIAGLSAGGASVHLHFLSPLSKNLFKKGISMSGSAFCPWVLTENASQRAKQLASSVGCKTKDSRKMIKCLKQRPGRKILSQIKTLFWPFLTNPIAPFAVVVENSGDTSFLNEHPYKLVSEGKVSDLPWLTSATVDEGLYPAAAIIDREELLKKLNDNWSDIVPHLLDYNYTIPDKNLNKVSNKIREFYFGQEDVSLKTRDKVVKMVGDRYFVVDTVRASKLQAAVTKSPVYYYYFGYQGKYSISVFISKFNSTLGVSHGDDQTFILSRPIISPLETEEDKAMMIKMTNIWISFIQTGKPSPDDGINWDTVDSHKDFTYLLINSPKDISQETAVDLGNSNFWDSLKFNELDVTYKREQKTEL